jgi:hypothetical protein
VTNLKGLVSRSPSDMVAVVFRECEWREFGVLWRFNWEEEE